MAEEKKTAGDRVNGLVLTVTKAPELKTSAGGKKYLKMSGLLHEDTDSGEKTWFEGVAFGGFAVVLSRHVGKGTKIKANGRVSVEEYNKKDGSGVGTSNKIVIDLAKVSGPDGVVTVTEFGVE